ncbi:MAG: VWD domain-containing protein [Woeseiaceae bacterium]
MCKGAGACSAGDPHLQSFDRVRFDFQGAGEYHFAKSHELDVDVQVRLTPYGTSRSVSVTRALAIRSGETRITVDTNRDNLIEIDGAPVLIRSGNQNKVARGSGVTLVRQNSTYRIVLPGEVEVSFWTAKTHLNVEVSSGPSGIGTLKGLGGVDDGDPSNDFSLRDGTTLSIEEGGLTFEQLYRQFGDSWRISQKDSLFDYSDGQSTASYTDLTFPDSQLTLADLDTNDRRSAEGICSAYGLQRGPVFDNCVYDVGFTGNEEFAAGYVGQTADDVLILSISSGDSSQQGLPAPDVRITDATLDASETASAGSNISVRWTGPANYRDYIAIARPEQAGNHYTVFSYLIEETDTVSLRVPGIPGDYEIRYVVDGGSRVVTSVPLKVIAVTATLETPATAGAGSSISVKWAGPANYRDHIALARPEQTSSHYMGYSYLVEETDTVTLRVPGIPGNYELRYVIDSDSQVITRVPLEVTAVAATLGAPKTAQAGSSILVNWTGPANYRDYISLARPEQTSSHYMGYSYLNTETGSVSLQAPDESGQYVIRYVIDSDSQVVAWIPITIE